MPIDPGLVPAPSGESAEFIRMAQRIAILEERLAVLERQDRTSGLKVDVLSFNAGQLNQFFYYLGGEVRCIGSGSGAPVTTGTSGVSYSIGSLGSFLFGQIGAFAAIVGNNAALPSVSGLYNGTRQPVGVVQFTAQPANITSWNTTVLVVQQPDPAVGRYTP